MNADMLDATERDEWIVATFPKEGMNRRERTARSKNPQWVAGFEDGYLAGRMWLIDDMRKWLLLALGVGAALGFVAGWVAK